MASNEREKGGILSKSIHNADVIVFEEEELDRVLADLNLVTSENGLLKDGEHEIECSGCHKPIEKERFAGVIPGSTHYLCDNPFCYSLLIASF